MFWGYAQRLSIYRKQIKWFESEGCKKLNMYKSEHHALQHLIMIRPTLLVNEEIKFYENI